MSKTANLRKVGITVGVLAVLASIIGTYAAFTATTFNDNNTFATGSVIIGDNDGGSAPLYVRTNAKPGDTSTGCIKVTYTGTLGSTVKLFTPSTLTNGSDFTLLVERGTQSTGAFPACGDFAQTSVAYTGDLGAFATTYAGGVDGKAAGTAWALNDNVAYRFTVTQKDQPAANQRLAARSSGTHTFAWEARNN